MCWLGYLQLHILVHILLIFSVKSDQIHANNNTNIEFSNISDNDVKGKRWAVLVAGSNGYENYRHQADVCHAYQTLRRGGLKDENIVVFMYDDIAFNPENPRPGIIINKPDGEDVYQGVPKDYSGDDVNVNNFYSVILGNRSAITGGSGKVVESGPNDNIFIYYADHGAPGILGMPNDEELVAKDFIEVLNKKHELGSYKKMVIYVEACESGSIFEGLLPSDLNIYAVTASNSKESSWGTYCPDDFPSPPSEYETCLGDVFSVSWLEDSDMHDMSKETLKQQYEVVRRRTAFDDTEATSHVMRYGSKNIQADFLISYIGTNPLNYNFTTSGFTSSAPSSQASFRHQRDIHLLYLRQKIYKAPKGSTQREEAKKKLLEEINRRKHIDQNIKKILHLVLQENSVSNVLASTRERGQPLVDDWNCFKNLVNSFKKHCGASSNYGLKYAGALGNFCNVGVEVEQTVSAIKRVCSNGAVPSWK